MKIDAGELNRYVALQRRKTADENSFGETPDEWETYTSVYAKRIQPQPGGEIQEGGQTVGKSPATFMIRYRDDVLTGHVVEDEGRRFEIRDVRDPDGTRVGLFLECNYFASGNA